MTFKAKILRIVPKITLEKFMSPRNEQQLFTYLFRFGLNFGNPNVGLAIFSRTSHGCNYGDSNMMRKLKMQLLLCITEFQC